MIKAESCPRNPADWQLFHNLTDLLEDLLKVIEPRKRLQDLVSASDFIAKSIIIFHLSILTIIYSYCLFFKLILLAYSIRQRSC